MSSAVSPSTNTHDSGIARAAGLIALGSIASRVLGLVREQLIAYLFGASGLVSAFGVAAIVPKMIYELLIGGMLSAALVPVFSQIAELKDRSALWGLFSRVASLAAIALAAIVLLLEVLAPQVAWLLGGGFDAELLLALTRMIRIIAPAVLFLGLSGVVTGLLYTLKRFTYPAFGAAVFNLGTIIAAPLLAGRIDAFSLAVGVALGAAAQLLIQLPELHRVRLRFRFRLGWSDPALRRILKLYIPVALGLVVSNVQVAIDRRLASSTGASSIAWMDRATTLIQLPHGLVAVAISLAVLPTLSRFSAQQNWDGFRRTLGQGVRMVLILIVPATLGLLVLAQPTIALLFEHGKFTATDTFWTAWALRYYLVGLIFAAVDWPLNYAFYARQDTLTPALVGILSVGVYLVVALLLIRRLGMLGLVLADSAKHCVHAGTMLVLTRRRLGSLVDMQLLPATFKALVASGAMAGAMVATQVGLARIPAFSGSWAELLTVCTAIGVGLLVYLGLSNLLGVDDLGVIRNLALQRLGRRHLD